MPIVRAVTEKAKVLLALSLQVQISLQLSFNPLSITGLMVLHNKDPLWEINVHDFALSHD